MPLALLIVTAVAAMLITWGPIRHHARPAEAEPLQALGWVGLAAGLFLAISLIASGHGPATGGWTAWQRILWRSSLGVLAGQIVACGGYAAALLLPDLAASDEAMDRLEPPPPNEWYLRGPALILTVTLALFPVLPSLAELLGISHSRLLFLSMAGVFGWLGVRLDTFVRDALSDRWPLGSEFHRGVFAALVFISLLLALVAG